MTPKYTVSPANAAALQAAGEAVREARAQHDRDVRELAQARKDLGDAEHEVERLAAEHRRWVQRCTDRLAEWQAGGRKGARPEALVDAKSVTARASSTVNQQSAGEIVTRLEAAEQRSRQAVAAAEQALFDAKVTTMREDAMGALTARLAAIRAEEIELYRQVAASEMVIGFGGGVLLDSNTAFALNNAPARPKLEQMLPLARPPKPEGRATVDFSRITMRAGKPVPQEVPLEVVPPAVLTDINSPRQLPSEIREGAIAYWMDWDAFLEQLASGGDVKFPEKAA